MGSWVSVVMLRLWVGVGGQIINLTEVQVGISVKINFAKSQSLEESKAGSLSI